MTTPPRMDPEQMWIQDLTLAILSNDQTLQALIEEIDLKLSTLTADIADNSIETNHIVNGTIINEDIADGTIGIEKLVPGTIPESVAGGRVDSIPIGTVVANTANQPPAGFLNCNGQVLASSLYPQLSAVLGDGANSKYGPTTAGNFTLPDLQCRVIVGGGTGAGLTPRDRAQKSGSETHTLSVNEMPAHSHNRTFFQDASPGHSNFLPNLYGSYYEWWVFRIEASSTTGGNAPHNNMMPFNVCIYMIRADVPPPGGVTLTLPTDLDTGVSVDAVLVWTIGANATAYQIQVDKTDDTFGDIVFDGTTSLLTVTVTPSLLAATTHYWRVRSLNPAGSSDWSDTYEFTTA